LKNVDVSHFVKSHYFLIFLTYDSNFKRFKELNGKKAIMAAYKTFAMVVNIIFTK
jgi:hypothetical protein